MIWFSSDLHFFHDKPFIYTPRGFNSVQDMNETIIKNFNQMVSWDDDLYILGDCFLNNNEEGMKCMRRLPGRIHIVRGNHDTDTRILMLEDEPRINYLGDAATLKANGLHFFLCHYPTATTNFDDNKPLKAKLLSLSGHTHSKDLFDIRTGSYNVALDAHNNFPVSVETIITDFKKEYSK